MAEAPGDVGQAKEISAAGEGDLRRRRRRCRQGLEVRVCGAGGHDDPRHIRRPPGLSPLGNQILWSGRCNAFHLSQETVDKEKIMKTPYGSNKEYFILTFSCLLQSHYNISSLRMCSVGK